MKGFMYGLTFGVLLLGSVCSAGSFYTWGPEELSEPAFISEAEWRAVALTARYSSPGYLTSKLGKRTFSVSAYAESLFLMVDTECQPNWDHYVGGSRFDVSDREIRVAYLGAAAEVLVTLKAFFGQSIDTRAVVIEFYIMGNPIAIYRNESLKLVGD